MGGEAYFSDADHLHFSFTSTITNKTSLSSSARSSFSSYESPTNTPTIHRNRWDPRFAAIKAAAALAADGNLQLSHLKLIRHLGTGNHGRVFLCQLKDQDGDAFALKVIDRDLLNGKKHSHVEMEGKVLSMLNHPFLPTLYAHIEASHYTCFLIDFCPNGDLHSLLRRQPGKRFSLPAVRFFAAEVLVALEYLHALGIVYRDLKPDNVLLRDDGHIMLSDFDLSFFADVFPTVNLLRCRTRNRFAGGGCFGSAVGTDDDAEVVVPEFVAEPVAAFSRSCVGTHEYLAPEVVSGDGHGNSVDWWAFGVLIHELLYGTTPFKGASNDVTLRNIVSSRKQMKSLHVAEAGVSEAKDLIDKLLVKDPNKRLGCTKGAQDIKRHPF